MRRLYAEPYIHCNHNAVDQKLTFDVGKLVPLIAN